MKFYKMLIYIIALYIHAPINSFKATFIAKEII